MDYGPFWTLTNIYLQSYQLLSEARMRFRSPPPLPSIFLMDEHLTKTRGGKKGQIRPMIWFLCFFAATRVTTGRAVSVSIDISSKAVSGQLPVCQQSGNYPFSGHKGVCRY